MNLLARLSAVLTLSLLLVSCSSASPMTKASAEERVAKWYEATGARYDLAIKDVPATITRSDPKRPNEGRDEIQVTWKGMTVTLAFGKAIDKSSLTTDFLAENFSYIVLDDIYAKIDTPGWDLRPRTPVSSNSKGVQFQEVTGGHLRFTVNWETYTVFGYSEKDACQEQLKIADSSVSKDCFVNVEKRLPLHLLIDARL